MLVLTRRIGERIFVGDAVVLTVLEMRGNKVRVGIDAPQEMLILREEIDNRVIEGVQPSGIGAALEAASEPSHVVTEHTVGT